MTPLPATSLVLAAPPHSYGDSSGGAAKDCLQALRLGSSSGSSPGFISGHHADRESNPTASRKGAASLAGSLSLRGLPSCYVSAGFTAPYVRSCVLLPDLVRVKGLNGVVPQL